MNAESTVREEGCTRCNEVSMGNAAFFCTACGRQIKPAPEGKFAFRAAEGSAEMAWKSFGFADAHAPSKRARAAIIGNTSAKCAASLALAATRSHIEKTVAPPTPEQARVMGVESVVEGIDWGLSTHQLQVLALARSDALRGRRRFFSSALPQTSPATPKTAVTTETAAPKRRSAERKLGDGRANPRRHESSVERTYIGNERGRGVSTQLSSGRRDWDDASSRQHQAKEASAPPKKGAKLSTTTSRGAASTSSAFPAALKKQRRRLEAEETQEQLVALARGGVRYAGKVFHRRGVKLTEDSPRSMLPRDAFQASGPHLLGQKELSMGRNGQRRIIVAELSAVVRAIPVDAAKIIGLVEKSPTFRRSQPPSGAHLAESSFVCDGVRLEVRPLPWCCQALHGECALDALKPTCLQHADQLSSGTAKIGATAKECLSAFHDGIQGSGSSGSPPLEERKSHRSVEEGGAALAHKPLPQVSSSLPTTSIGLADPQHDCPAASAGGRCHQRSVPVVFSRDFTHAELGALLGPTLSWKDPFEENRRTVGGLEASWFACLNSLCGRLRATVPEGGVCGEEPDDGRLPGAGEGVLTLEDGFGLVVAEKVGTLLGSIDGSRGNTEDGTHQKQCVKKGLAANTDVDRQGSPIVPIAPGAGDTVEKTRHPTGFAAGAGDDETRSRAVQALPLVKKRRAGGKVEEDAGGGVWFDKAILRVGARVPWGRLHRGRFAKVLFTVSLEEDEHGLEFAATSNSPTADPMLRGRWDFRATDRDLARYLSSGYAAVHGANRRVRPHAYDPQRCTVELQERGELEWACAVIARTAFRLVMVVPGGVVLSLAGVPIVGGREVPWPQDIEEDRVLCKASSDIQRAWRGCISRKRTRWLRMEREGRRRLSRMRKEAEDERERTRLLKEEEEAKAKLVLEEERRLKAQMVLAAATRGQVARRETSRRRAEQTARKHQLDEEASQAAAASSSLSHGDEETHETTETAVSKPIVDDDHEDNTTPGVTRLKRVLTIDGTEVHLTAHVKGAVDEGRGKHDQPMEILLVAVDKKARRSSRLSLDAADIGEIVGAHKAGKGGRVMKGAQAVLSAVLQKLTVFNSRRKDLFILSYRGKNIIATH